MRLLNYQSIITIQLVEAFTVGSKRCINVTMETNYTNHINFTKSKNVNVYYVLSFGTHLSKNYLLYNNIM